jgi:hypothetical protein
MWFLLAVFLELHGPNGEVIKWYPLSSAVVMG